VQALYACYKKNAAPKGKGQGEKIHLELSFTEKNPTKRAPKKGGGELLADVRMNVQIIHKNKYQKEKSFLIQRKGKARK